VKKLHVDVRRAMEHLTQELGRHPQVSELAKRLEISIEHVLEALKAGAAYRSASLDAAVGGDDATPLRDVGLRDFQDETMTELPDRIALVESVSRLPQRDREVVPFDLELAPDERTLLVSGPNTGGKTVLLKAIGLMSLLAQSGVRGAGGPPPPPPLLGSRISLSPHPRGRLADGYRFCRTDQIEEAPMDQRG
jgi:ATPase subunit of ABC transporter with duplicated ATPase domains